MSVVCIKVTMSVREERWAGARGEAEVEMQIPLPVLDTLDVGNLFEALRGVALAKYEVALCEAALREKEEED